MVSYTMVQQTQLPYNSNGVTARLPVAADHPSSAPQLKVRPNTACGTGTCRLARGYKPTGTNDAMPIPIVNGFMKSRIGAAAMACAAANAAACGTDTSPLATGRFLVRSTRASISRSNMSFTVQPTPRRSTDPTANEHSRPALGKLPGGATIAIDSAPGQNKSPLPIGLSSRISLPYGDTLTSFHFCCTGSTRASTCSAWCRKWANQSGSCASRVLSTGRLLCSPPISCPKDPAFFAKFGRPSCSSAGSCPCAARCVVQAIRSPRADARRIESNGCEPRASVSARKANAGACIFAMACISDSASTSL
ncbi:hypothetical protein FVE85_1261 [Porphyridium purpureum]|uniref:Uncharacterized protein n=1 Tax=Porphyridium purpureum TaxID=35688 RepID=A0A5J4YJ46_PORPP|nr:hypothetical protein FVE85_1261 [Porphyridium purpureum]|eukprot:POR1747..scf251_18